MAARWLIVGSTAAGKSTTGAALAERLAQPFIDLDALTEQAIGCRLTDAFADLGEASVRRVETSVACLQLAFGEGVLALGGGTFAAPEVRAAARKHGWFTIYLRVQPAVAAERVTADANQRPGCDDPTSTRALLEARFAARDTDYATADLVLNCDGLRPDEVLHRLVEALPSAEGDAAVQWLEGGAEELAERLHALVPSGRLLAIVDEALRERAESTAASLRARGRVVRLLPVAGGEASKSVTELERLWNGAFDGPIDRGDTVVTIGGGVVSDLGGFVAATLMRGLPVIHVTTTVMGMVDAALGGKTGIDLPVGKNLVGAFHAPRAVVQWGGALATLPDRAFRSGLAEVVKCALLRGEAELAALESDATALVSRDGAALARAVALASQTKLEIVARDPREQGERVLLNLGHTFAHALEAATGFETYLHGEAVAIGLVAALRFSVELGVTEAALPARVAALLQSLGLPTEPPPLAPEIWRAGLSRDKKRTDDAVRFVVCRRPGRCEAKVVELDRVDAWIRRTFSGNMMNG